LAVGEPIEYPERFKKDELGRAQGELKNRLDELTARAEESVRAPSP